MSQFTQHDQIRLGIDMIPGPDPLVQIMDSSQLVTGMEIEISEVRQQKPFDRYMDRYVRALGSLVRPDEVEYIDDIPNLDKGMWTSGLKLGNTRWKGIYQGPAASESGIPCARIELKRNSYPQAGLATGDSDDLGAPLTGKSFVIIAEPQMGLARTAEKPGLAGVLDTNAGRWLPIATTTRYVNVERL